MATKVYKNYGNIIKFLKGNHLLNAQFYVPNEEQTYIPVTNIKIVKPPHPRGSNSQLMLKFETFDRNSGELSTDQYHIMLQYLKELHISKGAYYQVLHHIDPLTTKDTVNYITGMITLVPRLIKHIFTLHKQKLCECEFLGENGEIVYLLLSPTLNPMWITKFGAQETQITKSNLKNIMVLIQHHLINNLYAFYINSKHTFNLQMFTSYSVNTSKDMLRIYYNTGNIALNLDKANVYLIDTDKHNPAFKINYPNDHVTYYLILSPIFNKHLLPTLLQ